MDCIMFGVIAGKMKKVYMSKLLIKVTSIRPAFCLIFNYFNCLRRHTPFLCYYVNVMFYINYT